MPYVLDKWQYISGFNMKVVPADYVVVYGRFDPPFSSLCGYAMLRDPLHRDLVGNEETTSVGEWEPAVTPHGSRHRSYPELDNGAATNYIYLPTRLPEEGELDDVYLWHVGWSHLWGVGDQIIINLKKLKADYPDYETFTVGMAGATSYPRVDGDGDRLETPEGYAGGAPLRLYCGIRAWHHPEGGGTWDFGPVDKPFVDPFGTAVKEVGEELARYSGGELAAQYEVVTAGAAQSVGPNIWYLRGWNAVLDHKHPKKSVLSGGPIFTE